MAFLPLVPALPWGGAKMGAGARRRGRGDVRCTVAPVPGAPATAGGAQRARVYDVVVAGAGPAGLSLAAELGERGLAVACVDARVQEAWPNHYGVWRDEFAEVGLEDCCTKAYGRTVVYVGDGKRGSATEEEPLEKGGRVVLDRGYLRVDRVRLKERLMERCRRKDVDFVEAYVDKVVHQGAGWSEVEYSMAGREQGKKMRARLMVDATGHSLRFTSFHKDAHPPSFQAAYGIEAEVESHSFPLDEMLLMDFRDRHMQGNAQDISESNVRPTFLYVFPTSRTRVFLEETSIIAPQQVPFDELKRRLYMRIKDLGIRVVKVVEEEFSLIRMGGSVPDLNQRVVGFGGAACLVHPATGYMIARTLARSREVADAIAAGIQGAESKSKGPGGVLHGMSNGTEVEDRAKDMEKVARAVWETVWSLEERRQRDFLTFGADLLAVLSIEESRLFFDAFFKLPQELWSGFLSFKLDKPELRMWFALRFFMVAGWKIRMQLLVAMWEIGRWRLIRSVLPLGLSGHE